MFDWLYKTLGLAYREAWAVVQIFENAKEMFTGFSLKGFFAGLMAIFELFGMLFFGLPTTPRGEKLNLDGYSLVMYDEFGLYKEMQYEAYVNRIWDRSIFNRFLCPEFGTIYVS